MSATDYLEEIYFDPKHPAGYTGAEALYRWAKKKYPVTKKFVEKWLQGVESYSLHKQVRRKFPRNKVIVDSIGEQYDMDLLDMSNAAKYNDNYKYILVSIDIFSRFLRVRPLKSKKGEHVVQAIKTVFKEQVPMRVRTDKGREFLNPAVKKLFKQKHVVHIVAQNTEIKANYSERVNKTLKKKIYRYFTEKQTYRYIDKLQDFVYSYNHAKHRSIKKAPADVTIANQKDVWFQQYAVPLLLNERSKVKNNKQIKVGDLVRISHIKRAFEREYDLKWTGEYFVVSDIDKSRRIYMYQLKDYSDEPIKGLFYAQELNKVRIDPNQPYKIEKVLKTRKKGKQKEYFIKFLYWPDQFNTWLSAKELVHLSK